jgi:pimeloyl-ACP methyl ester carboxylesterase
LAFVACAAVTSSGYRSYAKRQKDGDMPFATLDGIKTHYVKQGSGPFLLMMAPRGFESTLQSWDHGKWKEMNAIDTLSRHFTVVAYDRRESGLSGGRVEVLTWKVFAQHAKLLLEHLDIDKTFVLGVCMGVAVATQLACIYPEACTGLILAQPVGGHRWKVRTHTFFNRHLEFVCENGLEAVRARATGKNFMRDPEAGPWASAIFNDPVFAERFVKQDLDAYVETLVASRDAMFPDTFVSGVQPAELMTIDTASSIWPGDDASHSTSGAQQLRELMPRMEYWDLHPSKQTSQDMLERLLTFKDVVETTGLAPSPAMPGPQMPAKI